MDDDLVAVLAHGWVNNMAAISGAAQTLVDFEEQLNPDHRAELLTMIIKQATHLRVDMCDALLGGQAMAEAGARD